MVDIHTHILPNIDDGSKSLEETSEMLRLMLSDGIKSVVATPHFYNTSTVDEFCKKRDKAAELVKGNLDNIPDIRLGAEILVEYGVNEVKGLSRLRIEGTDWMLVEPPYTKWDDWIFDELFKISARCGTDLIIAHAERYILHNPISSIERLADMGFKIQVNADNIGSFLHKSAAVSLMKKGLVDFMASDCHNMTNRPPNLGKAFKKISFRLGKEYASRLVRNSEELLEI